MTATTPGSNEQKQVLEMLSNGKIDVEDAQRLLDKLREIGDQSPDTDKAKTADKAQSPKYVRIQSTGEHEGDRINLRIPLGMARAGLGISSILPDWVQRHVVVGGIDLTKEIDLASEDLLADLEELDISLDSPDGETVRIFCE